MFLIDFRSPRPPATYDIAEGQSYPTQGTYMDQIAGAFAELDGKAKPAKTHTRGKGNTASGDRSVEGVGYRFNDGRDVGVDRGGGGGGYTDAAPAQASVYSAFGIDSSDYTDGAPIHTAPHTALHAGRGGGRRGGGGQSISKL